LSATIGRQRTPDHMVATDTIDDLPVDEQRALLAHELGHLRLGHVATLERAGTLQRVAATMVGAITVVIADTDGSQDPRAYGVFRVATFLAAMVIMSMMGRWRQGFERAADQHALTLTRDPEAFKRMVLSITRANRSPVAGFGASNACGLIAPAERLESADRWAAAQTPPAPGGAPRVD
ncbi:MAG: M48 family metalloprotease, partial [Actinomycetota bacterium]|nr:M48 family metalloprotease [Actinomycetota bacterium]